MTKTKEELLKLQEDIQKLNEKLNELSDEELVKVTGGGFWDVLKKIGDGIRSVAKPILKDGTPSIVTNNDDSNII